MKSSLGALTLILLGGPALADSLMIDDFSSGTGQALVGGSWQGFTDRVMGGLSDIRAGLLQEGGDVLLRMEGVLSLENNGGFIQVRLPLNLPRLGLNLSQYSGIRITYRQNLPGDYAVHLRSSSNPRPWAHHSALIQGVESQDGSGFRVAEIPWSAFVGDRTRTRSLPWRM
jgi:hypothetical protein